MNRLPQPALSFSPIPAGDCSHALRMRCPPILEMGLMDLGDWFPPLKGLLVPWEVDVGPGAILCVDCRKYERRFTRKNGEMVLEEWEMGFTESAGGQAGVTRR